MRAMILCAGLGTRLRPFTSQWPKPAIPFLGAPLLRLNLALLHGAGITGVGINTHHLGPVMEDLASKETARFGLRFEAVHEPVIQGTGGGIRGLRRFLEGGTFVVFNGDILFALDLAGVIARHKASGAAATMVLLPMPVGEKYAAVECDAKGDVRRIAGNGPGGDGLTPWHFTGVHVMEPRVFDFMTPEGEEDINRSVYPRLMAAGHRVRGDVVEGYWSDLGTPQRYLATVGDVLSGRVGPEVWGKHSPLQRFRTGFESAAFIDTGVDAGAVKGPVALEPGAAVDLHAHVQGPVHLGLNVQVPAGVSLENAVVFEDTVLAEGESLKNVLAWREHRIPA